MDSETYVRDMLEVAAVDAPEGGDDFFDGVVRHRRRHRLARASAALLGVAAIVGGALVVAAVVGNDSPRVATKPGDTPADAQPCTGAALTARLWNQGQDGLGRHFAVVSVRNSSDRACRLSGDAAIETRNDSGVVVTQTTTPQPRGAFVLPAGAEADLMIGYATDGAKCDDVAQLALDLAAGEVLTVPFTERLCAPSGEDAIVLTVDAPLQLPNSPVTVPASRP